MQHELYLTRYRTCSLHHVLHNKWLVYIAMVFGYQRISIFTPAANLDQRKDDFSARSSPDPYLCWMAFDASCIVPQSGLPHNTLQCSSYQTQKPKASRTQGHGRCGSAVLPAHGSEPKYLYVNPLLLNTANYTALKQLQGAICFALALNLIRLLSKGGNNWNNNNTDT